MAETKRLTPRQLEAIRSRAEKATEGPWALSNIVRSSNRMSHMQRQGICAGKRGTIATTHRAYAEWRGVVKDDDNADFIAHSREDVPALLAEIEALKEERTEYRTAIRNLDALSELFRFGMIEHENKSEYITDEIVRITSELERKVGEIV